MDEVTRIIEGFEAWNSKRPFSTGYPPYPILFLLSFSNSLKQIRININIIPFLFIPILRPSRVKKTQRTSNIFYSPNFLGILKEFFAIQSFFKLRWSWKGKNPHQNKLTDSAFLLGAICRLDGSRTWLRKAEQRLISTKTFKYTTGWKHSRIDCKDHLRLQRNTNW